MSGRKGKQCRAPTVVWTQFLECILVDVIATNANIDRRVVLKEFCSVLLLDLALLNEQI